MVFEVLADLSECLLNSQCYSLSGNVWTPSFLFGWHNIAGCWSASCYQPFGLVNQVLACFQILKIQKPSTSLSTSVNCFQILKIQSLVNQVLSALVGFSVNGCLIVCTACWMLIVWKSDGFLKKILQSYWINLCLICFVSTSNTMVYKNDIHNWSWQYVSIKSLADS